MAVRYKILIAGVVAIVIGVVWIVHWVTAGAKPTARAFVTGVRKGTDTNDMVTGELAKAFADPASEPSRTVAAIRRMSEPELEVRTAGFRGAFAAYACVAGKSAENVSFFIVVEKVHGAWRVFEVATAMPHSCEGGD